jgi:negative regulator of flagellin synthesis FlgM
MNASEPDHSEKIARLKAQIDAGTYEMDYDAIAEKILTSEF